MKQRQRIALTILWALGVAGTVALGKSQEHATLRSGCLLLALVTTLALLWTAPIKRPLRLGLMAVLLLVVLGVSLFFMRG